ncbi:MAG: FkbM family methyltransferase [Bacteriovoracaceae bacterium]|nr:FkbM family methyltransferase [Bacteriovoracaceae bacterium]
MKNLLKRLIGFLIGKSNLSSLAENFHLYSYKGEASFSQEGEDRVLKALLKNKQNGFYVDIGAHHPKFLSNTQIFYQEGWSGINIDANPECMRIFHKLRPRDINVTSGVGRTKALMKFYSFQEPALSTFDEKLAADRESAGRILKDRFEIEILPLSDILNKHMPKGQMIDFLTVDVEGFDLDVLKSNDWSKFRPRFILVECLGLEIESLQANETYQYLKSQKYNFKGRLINTCLFTDEREGNHI